MENMLRPCPMLENPECLCSMVKRTEAYSTDMQSPEDIDDLYAKCKPYADRWAPKAKQRFGLQVLINMLHQNNH